MGKGVKEMLATVFILVIVEVILGFISWLFSSDLAVVLSGAALGISIFHLVEHQYEK